MLSDDQLWRKTRKLYQEEKVITVCPLGSAEHVYTVRIRKALSPG